MVFQELTEQGQGRTFRVSSSGAIGRDAASAITLNDTKVSRRHATLSLTGNELVIEDAGSSNGTFVNDTRLQPHQPCRLRPGDVVRAGRTRLRYEGMAAEAVLPSGIDDFADFGGSPPEARRPRWLLWAAAAVVLALVALAAVIASRDDVISLGSETDTPTAPPIVVITPDTPTPPVVVTRPPEPTPTPRPSPMPSPTPAPAAGAAAQPQAPSQAQPPPSAGGMFSDVPPEQLPQALAQGVLSGQISPDAAQVMVQEMFPGVPPEQLPAVMAQALQSMPPEQLQALFKMGFPFMQAP